MMIVCSHIKRFDSSFFSSELLNMAIQDDHNLSQFLDSLQMEDGIDVERIQNNQIIISSLKNTQMSLLNFACSISNASLVSSLLEKGEDVNAKGKDGFCAIHVLCRSDGNSHVRLIILDNLLKHNARVDEQDDSGRTALHHACIFNQVLLAERLLKAGCSVDIQDIDKDTPFTTSCRLASESWYFWNNDCLNDEDHLFQPEDFPPYRICQMLLKHGADPKQATLLPSAVLFSTMDVVKEFLDLGMDVNMMDENRRTSLGCACSSPYIPSSMVRLLLNHGADANEGGGGQKNKPIIIAYVYNSVEKIRLLLSYGATIGNEEMSEIVSISLSKWFLENPEIIHEDSAELASWKLLLKAGFRPQLDMLMMKIKRITLCSRYAHASPWIFNLLFPMSSLKDICRVSIRSQLSPSVDENIDSLPLPNRLKEFLKFKN